MTTRTALSAAMSSRWACKDWTISVVSALSFSGRLSVSWAMPGSGEVRSTTGIRPSLPTAGYGRHVATVMLASPPGPATGRLPHRCGRATTLGVYRTGRSDPTTRLLGDDHAGSFWRATWTPDGPGTVHVRWRGDVVLDRQAWGA